MKKSNWLALALFAAASVCLRVWQNLTGFEETGLARRGNLPALLLPLVFALAAAYFAAASRKLPSGGAPDMADCFRFARMPAALCAVAGAFLVIGGAAAYVMEERTLTHLLLAGFAIAAAVSVLATAGALRRGSAVPGVVLFVPVCCLVVFLIFLYRADASDPVLARVYVEILATAALTFAALKRAAFAVGDGSPRVWLPACALSAVLSLSAAADGRSLAALLFFAGSALVEFGFLASAKF